MPDVNLCSAFAYRENCFNKYDENIDFHDNLVFNKYADHWLNFVSYDIIVDL